MAPCRCGIEEEGGEEGRVGEGRGGEGRTEGEEEVEERGGVGSVVAGAMTVLRLRMYEGMCRLVGRSPRQGPIRKATSCKRG